MNNLILMTDSYKASHWLQYPPNTTNLFSYIESRGGQWDKTLFFGLQIFLKEYLSKPITKADIDEAQHFFEAHGEPFNKNGWMYILEKHKGYMPVRIRAVAEGNVVPTHNCLMTVESTDKEVSWIVSWLETALLRSIWYPTTVATQSWYIKQLIHSYLQQTAHDADSEIMFKLHDFGARGVSSHESAMLGGAAHLVNFMGSDTVEGVYTANKYYKSSMAAFSIPAMEHSSVTSWGKEHEVEAYDNMLDHFAKPGSLLACVSDSYNLWNAIEYLWGDALKQKVLASGATLVIRPDSGHPATVVRKAAELLADRFGYTTNSKGYKLLNNVRLIQGDGINFDSIKEILDFMKDAGFSASNVAFGMGGGLLQHVNRDTQKFAYKCSSVTVDGKERDVFKSPITDPGKMSKPGRLDLIRENNEYKTVRLDNLAIANSNSIMHTVFEDGQVKKEWTLEEVRAHSNGALL